ncbi:hypothetical protein L5515_001373 [Caenorhabditis briggsae]|uniref:RING-type domain-containing protein n=2 Tax=Caenorhabditis briggsae TaxID=6238 RepID=A0AAE9E183_CAEBR|nr:hypothetical protein L5515_001373 [Caenorhabditis briggsae]
MAATGPSMVSSALEIVHCNECATKFNERNPGILVSCGHNVCKECAPNLSGKYYFCMVCKKSQPQIQEGSSFLQLLVEKMEKDLESTCKEEPKRSACSECRMVDFDTNLTICHECSKWEVGDSHEEHTDYAKRPIRWLMCFPCAEKNHSGHPVMTEETVKKMLHTSESTKRITHFKHGTEKLLNWFSLAENIVSENKVSTNQIFQELMRKVNNGEYSVGSGYPHIIKALDNFNHSFNEDQLAMRNIFANFGIRKNYMQCLLKFVDKTKDDTGTFNRVEVSSKERLTDTSSIILKHVTELAELLEEREHSGDLEQSGDDENAVLEDADNQDNMSNVGRKTPQPNRKSTRRTAASYASADESTPSRKKRKGSTEKTPRSTRKKVNKKEASEVQPQEPSRSDSANTNTMTPPTIRTDITPPLPTNSLNPYTSPLAAPSMIPQNLSVSSSSGSVTPLLPISFEPVMSPHNSQQHQHEATYDQSHTDYQNHYSGYANIYDGRPLSAQWDHSRQLYESTSAASEYSALHNNQQQTVYNGSSLI